MEKFSSPLSGTFFQYKCEWGWAKLNMLVFVPSLGDFFSITMMMIKNRGNRKVFVPSLGDFFSIDFDTLYRNSWGQAVFVPSLGDFFSIGGRKSGHHGYQRSFRPLSRGLFFNQQFPD